MPPAASLAVLAILCALVGLSLTPSPAHAAGTGKITGTVTDARTGDQLEAIGVCAQPVGTGGASCVSTGERIGGERGRYEIGGLAEGSYYVEFFQGPFGNTYLVQFWNDKESHGEADPVTVTEGQTTSGIDAAMHEGGRITGTVTAAFGGAPIRGILACALEPTGSGSPIECAETDAAGEYAITGLYGGSYKVGFYPTGLHCDCASENYRTQFYDGMGSSAEAEPITVSVGATRGGVDARMVSMRTLTVSLAGDGSGTVTSSPAGIDCGSTCSAEYGAGEEVSLTASPAAGSTFAGFSGGGCDGTGPCRITVSGDLAVTATFEPASGGTPGGGGGTPGGGGGNGGMTGVPPPSSPTPPENPQPTRPDTKIVAARIKAMNGTATFHFKAIGTATGFECRLRRLRGKARSGPCASPRTYRHLRPGGYVFSVRAIGPGGRDRSTARRRFRIRR